MRWKAKGSAEEARAGLNRPREGANRPGGGVGRSLQWRLQKTLTPALIEQLTEGKRQGVDYSFHFCINSIEDLGGLKRIKGGFKRREASMAFVHGERLKTTLAYSLEAPSLVSGPSASWAWPMRKGEGGKGERGRERGEGEGRLGLNLGCGPLEHKRVFFRLSPSFFFKFFQNHL